jgi:hypothetical protein
MRPRGLQRVVFSAAEYPNIRRHFRAALRRACMPRLEQVILRDRTQRQRAVE